MGYLDDYNYDPKRALSSRNKQILWLNANKRCQNPACGKKLDFIDIQVGHKTAWSRGGRTTLRNSVCLCYTCNKLQGTDSWATFLKKRGVEDPKSKLKKSLESLNMKQLKFLADKHHIKIKGSIVEDFLDSYRRAPTKRQYINKLSGIVTEKELGSIPKEAPRTVRRKKRRNSDSLW